VDRPTDTAPASRLIAALKNGTLDDLEAISVEVKALDAQIAQIQSERAALRQAAKILAIRIHGGSGPRSGFNRRIVQERCERIREYLLEHGPSGPAAIAAGLELPVYHVNAALRHKEFARVAEGWIATERDSELPKEE